MGGVMPAFFGVIMDYVKAFTHAWIELGFGRKILAKSQEFGKALWSKGLTQDQRGEYRSPFVDEKWPYTVIAALPNHDYEDLVVLTADFAEAVNGVFSGAKPMLKAVQNLDSASQTLALMGGFDQVEIAGETDDGVLYKLADGTYIVSNGRNAMKSDLDGADFLVAANGLGLGSFLCIDS